jgi:hypothetical protein
MEDNIKMDTMEIDCDGIDWNYLDQSRIQWRNFNKILGNYCTAKRVAYSHGILHE